MKRRTQVTTLLGVGSALLMGGVAHAQGYPGGGSTSGSTSGSYPSSSSGSYPSSGSSSSSSAPGANDAGAVNSSSFSTTDTTSTSTTTPPNTGGEPLLMSLLGSLTAGSALLLRRKLS